MVSERLQIAGLKARRKAAKILLSPKEEKDRDIELAPGKPRKFKGTVRRTRFTNF